MSNAERLRIGLQEIADGKLTTIEDARHFARVLLACAPLSEPVSKPQSRQPALARSGDLKL
jgi:hypothetical protein